MARRRMVRKTPKRNYWGGLGPRYAQFKYAKSTGIPRKRRGLRLRARLRGLFGIR